MIERDALHAFDAFRWQTQPDASALIDEALALCLARCPQAERLAEDLLSLSGTRLRDYLERVRIPRSDAGDSLASRLAGAGFSAAAHGCFRHPAALLPQVEIGAAGSPTRVVVAVEALASRPWPAVQGGSAGELAVVELPGNAAAAVGVAAVHLNALRNRPRPGPHEDQAQAFSALSRMIAAAIAACGRDLACALFFAAEREYWQARTRAGAVQKAMQDAIGMGWANHDHHTYRSSRACFTRLIALFEEFGFTCRERFHPGAAAGWGAQVLEHAATGIVIFADVDMSHAELCEDFAHQPFPADEPGRALGTVGLWCALHGESLFAAGMHHLACRVDAGASRTLLARAGIQTMPPFSDLPHLRQCFTVGETWPVSAPALAALVGRSQLSREQAEHFDSHGALGAHLELIERNDGFKGFNQHGVDQIIAGTDPRRAG